MTGENSPAKDPAKNHAPHQQCLCLACQMHIAAKNIFAGMAGPIMIGPVVSIEKILAPPKLEDCGCCGHTINLAASWVPVLSPGGDLRVGCPRHAVPGWMKRMPGGTHLVGQGARKVRTAAAVHARAAVKDWRPVQRSPIAGHEDLTPAEQRRRAQRADRARRKRRTRRKLGHGTTRWGEFRRRWSAITGMLVAMCYAATGGGRES